jgi:hypothetical protein
MKPECVPSNKYAMSFILQPGLGLDMDIPIT